MTKIDHIIVGDPPKFEIEGITSCVHFREFTDQEDVAYDIVNDMLKRNGIRSVCLREWGEVKEIFFPSK